MCKISQFDMKMICFLGERVESVSVLGRGNDILIVVYQKRFDVGALVFVLVYLLSKMFSGRDSFGLC